MDVVSAMQKATVNYIYHFLRIILYQINTVLALMSTNLEVGKSGKKKGMSSQKKNKNNKKGGRSSGPSHDGNICNPHSINKDPEAELEVHKKENERLKKENEKLTKENQVLKEEKVEILRENEQLKQEKQKLEEFAERKANVNNRIPENDEMEIDPVTCFEDTHVSTQHMMENSASQQTIDVHTAHNSSYLGTASANQDMHHAPMGIVCDDRFESEPNKGQSWSSDTESELKSVSGSGVSLSESTQEKNKDTWYGKDETLKNQSRFNKPQKQKTGSNKRFNGTYGNEDRNDQQYNIRGRSARDHDYGQSSNRKPSGEPNEWQSDRSDRNPRGGPDRWQHDNYNRRPSGGPDRRQPDFERGRGNGKQSSRNYYQKSEGNQQQYDKNKEQFSKVKFLEINGDLFAAPTDNSLAHCVAEDLRMGSGIAVQFKQQFKNVGELLGQRKRVGQVAVLEEKGRFIYYLITKKHSTGKPTLLDLKDALEDMKKHVEKNQVKNIAIPRLGCGLDRLDWREVRQLLKSVFADVDVTITAYNFTMEMQDSLDQPPKKSLIYISDRLMKLVDIQRNTLIVLFGSECGYVDKTMQELDGKFRFVQEYKTKVRNLGEVIELEKSDIICILIAKKHEKDLISYPALEECFMKLKKIFKKHEYGYMGFSAFMDGGDDLTIAKVVSLLKVVFAHTYCDTWICWPDEMKNAYEEYKQAISSYKGEG